MTTFTALCLDDSVTTCDCCGRTDLKATVLMQSDLGDLVHFGQVCAARNSNKTRQQVTKEIRAERDAAHGRASNRLMDLRRAGIKITRQIVGEVAASVRADATILIRQWV
jgi:hypothetical protein